MCESWQQSIVSKSVHIWCNYIESARLLKYIYNVRNVEDNCVLNDSAHPEPI